MKKDLKKLPDLSPREILIFTPLAIVVLWLGIYPNPFIEIIEPSVANLIETYQTALQQDLEIVKKVALK